MHFSRFSWKTILFPISCFKNNNKKNKNPSEPKLPISKQISLQSRVSLADFSNPSSSILLTDLSSSLLIDLHVFGFKELELITQNFSECNYLGEGGFGEVHKGFIDDNLSPRLKAQPVAVKALKLDGTQGHREWLAEVIFLGQFKHPHLVNLIGYCCEDEHRLLVYEYMERGNLENHLFKRYAGALPWLTRIKILVGAAKGLAFLHEEVKPVIYRDFKTSNILLSSDFSSKLSDFGLATDGPDGEESHVTTCVMGTEGYAAPEYVSTGHLTTMSDVFSFGVVLLELLTGRRAVDKSRPRRERDLVEWARPLLKDAQKLEGIIDPRLEGQYSIQGAKRAATLAYQCLSHVPKSRPTMSTVVKTLEPLLDLTDIPLGPFVYVVTHEGVSARQIGRYDDDVKIVKQEEEKENKEEKRKKGTQQRRRGRKHRRKMKTMRSRVVYSDTTLYMSLGTSLYSPRK